MGKYVSTYIPVCGSSWKTFGTKHSDRCNATSISGGQLHKYFLPHILHPELTPQVALIIPIFVIAINIMIAITVIMTIHYKLVQRTPGRKPWQTLKRVRLF